jgi:molybdopterin converting factor small subunit
MELENYKIENNKLKNDLVKANKIIENLQKNQNDNSNIKSLHDEIKNLKNQLYLKENEINQMKLKIKNNNKKDDYFKLDDIMVINFTSTDSSINHGIKCVVTDTFAEVEEKLYQIYDEFRNTNNMFTIKGRTILRFKTLKENNIKDGDKVLLFRIE